VCRCAHKPSHIKRVHPEQWHAPQTGLQILLPNKPSNVHTHTRTLMLVCIHIETKQSLNSPSTSMRTTPRPADPAPRHTTRWSARSRLLFPYRHIMYMHSIMYTSCTCTASCTHHVHAQHHVQAHHVHAQHGEALCARTCTGANGCKEMRSHTDIWCLLN
jgi:hypothetical protein